jgi:anhydro-N-acetylmuramic acid kinase
MLVLGIMSGTSIDGVDYALCEITRRSVMLVRHWSRKFPRALRLRLHAAGKGDCGSHELAQLHHDLGRLYARQAAALACGAEMVGLHGQTVFHNPSRKAPATLQIGEPAYLAEVLRVPVVSNFRAADIAAGGQGAPLATLFHRTVFARRGEHVCVNNLGGISNVTSLDWRSGPEPLIESFDTGPANVLMDIAMRNFTGGRLDCDRNGSWASRGSVAEKVLKAWLQHPYFRRQPPKSTGRELFGEAFWSSELRRLRTLNERDVLATLAEFTARSIALNYQLHLSSAPSQTVLCGGGALNGHLTSRIAVALAPLGCRETISSAQLGWPAQAIEPAAFALLAYLRASERTGNLPATTGARRSAIMGQITAAPSF